MKLMAMAGYDPRAALDLWELMACVEEDARNMGQSTNVENRFALLRTHPTSEDRQDALQKDLNGAMRLWREHAPKVREKLRRDRDIALSAKAAAEQGESSSSEASAA
jgi:predicted Zn-dependent protease